MKATGIVRRLDDLGRVVIPKEIRRTMGVREGDPLEMYVDTESGGLVLVPYNSTATAQLREVAENLKSLGNTPAHWQIGDQLDKLIKKLEELENESEE